MNILNRKYGYREIGRCSTSNHIFHHLTLVKQQYNVLDLNFVDSGGIHVTQTHLVQYVMIPLLLFSFKSLYKWTEIVNDYAYYVTIEDGDAQTQTIVLNSVRYKNKLILRVSVDLIRINDCTASKNFFLQLHSELSTDWVCCRSLWSQADDFF